MQELDKFEKLAALPTIREILGDKYRFDGELSGCLISCCDCDQFVLFLD